MPLPTSVKRLSEWALHPAMFKDAVVGEGNGYNVHLTCTAWLALLMDSPVDGLKTNRQGWRFVKMLTRGYTSVVRSFSILGDDLCRSLLSDDFGSSRLALHKAFARTPIFREYHYFWKTGDMEALQYILSFLWFAKKGDYFSQAFLDKALHDWKLRETFLGSIDFSTKRTDPLRRAVSRLLPEPDNVLVFKHGPGAVAERGVRTILEKEGWLHYHPFFEEILLSAQGSVYLRYALPEPLLRCVSPDFLVSDDVARVLMVRKNYKTARSVGMEPTTFMYIQQGVLSMLARAMKKGRLSDFVDLNDQNHNRRLCVEASASQSHATIDLASASDSIAWELVRRIFSDHWLVYLGGSRTSDIQLPDNSRVRAKKFAPMGSAVCFGAQNVIFTSVGVVAYSCWIQGLTFEDFCNGIPISIEVPPAEWLRVFGDDIIIREELVDLMIVLLGYYGFTVNVDKSFRAGSSVRESCGVYACDGVDVTPDIMKTKDLMIYSFGYDPISIRIAYSLIAMANQAYRRKWMVLRGVLIQWIHPGTYVIMDERSPYARGPWVVLGREFNHSSRKVTEDRMQRWCVKLLRYATEDDVVFAVRDDGNGLIIPFSAATSSAFWEDNAYWYSIALAKGMGYNSSVNFAPLKDLDRRSYLRRTLTPVE